MLGLMEVKCEINFHFLIQFREDLTGWEKAAVLKYDSWATAYPVAQHSPTHNTCITIYKKKRKICMLKFYLAEHTRASAAAAGPLLNANCCLWPPASCGHVPRLSTASQVQPCRRGKVFSRHPRFISAIYFAKYQIAFSIVPCTCNLLSIIQ